MPARLSPFRLSALTIWVLAALVALATAGHLTGRHGPSTGQELNPTPKDLKGLWPTRTTSDNSLSKRMTNAERLTRHLPPNPPTRRSHSRREAPHVSAVPQGQVTKIINFEAPGAPPDIFLGLPSWTGYGKLTISEENVARITFSYSPLVLGPQEVTGVTVATFENAWTDYPVFGLCMPDDGTGVQGELVGGKYAMFAGVASPGTPSGAAPSLLDNTYTVVSGDGAPQYCQTSVWMYDSDPVESSLSLQWVNPNGELASNIGIYVMNQAFYVTQDIDALKDHLFPDGEGLWTEIYGPLTMRLQNGLPQWK